MTDEDLPGRPICHCRTKPIGPHWHDSRQYGCPMQPVPAQRPASLETHPGLTLEEAEALQEAFVAADEVICSHGNPGYCDACAAEAYARNEQDRDGSAAFLDASDPFERVLIDIVRTNRRKRRDYALDGSPFSNFDTSAAGMGLEGFGGVESAIFNVNQKLARLRSLRANGRLDDPENESVTDTYLDLAVYAVIALAIHHYPDGKVPWETT